MRATPVCLIGVFLVAGCAAPHQPMSPVPRPVDFAPMVPVDVLAIAPPEQYALLATLRFPAPIDAVIPSSTHDDFHPVLHVTDNRLTSAWAPDERDASPTLTFQLAESVNIDSAAIKLSLGRVSSAGNQRVRVDLFASNDGGATWTQLVDDFRPRETTLDSVTFPTTLANTVRMTFETDAPHAIRDLYVCEANIIDPITMGRPSASPWPTPTPSDPSSVPAGTWSPTPTPSLTPTPSPTPTPYLRECGTFQSNTQGGWSSTPSGNNPGMWLATHWNSLTEGSPLTVGTGRTLTFTTAAAVRAFLPAGGTPGALSASATNPTGSTTAGAFAGQVTALKLNVLRASHPEYWPTGAIAPLGSLVLADGPYAGYSATELLALAEEVLGGATPPAGTSVSQLNDAAARFNQAFVTPQPPFLGEFECPTYE